jgi:signal transduction histidine kinase/ActR/RegA family two-component response regulator
MEWRSVGIPKEGSAAPRQRGTAVSTVDDGASTERGEGAGRLGLLAYILGLALATTGLAAWLVYEGYGISSAWALLLIAALAAVTERGTVRVSANLDVSVFLVPVLLAAVALGPLAAMITGAASMLGDVDRRPLRMLVYTLSRTLTAGLAGLAAASVLDALGDGLGGIVVATVAAAITAQALDATFAAVTLALRGTGATRDVARIAPRLALAAAAYVPLVAVLAFSYQEISPWTLVLFLIPAVAAHRLLVLYQRERGLVAEVAAANAHLRRRDAMLQAVGAAAQLFLETTSLDDAVNGMLAQLGEAADADHVSMLEVGDGEPALRYAWSRAGRGTPPALHSAERDVSVPIVTGRTRWGTIGFPARADGREWSAAEVDGLRAAASLLGAAIERERAEQELRSRDERLRQSQKMEAVGRLAGGIAHDFNNLLTVIGGYSQVLLGELESDHPARSDALAILKAAQRAEGLTRQLLTFSRKQVLAPEVLDLNGVVREADGLLRRVLGEDIDLKTDLDHRLPRILADPGQVEQIILNLAVNARDAMPRGGELRLVTARVEGSGPDEPAALLEVHDTGHGMDDTTRERIFEPFFTTKDVGKGTGLGLATVHGIVEQSGGRIEVESEVGQGTVFRVFFPVSSDTAAPAGETRAPAAHGGTETILLVEDEAVLRGLAARILRGAGYLVLEAGDADEALSVSEAYPGVIDLLLTDVVMPRTSGHELVEMVTRQRLFARTLLMSGYAQELSGGPADLPSGGFLAKPFSPEGLLQAVRDALDARPYAAQGADV